MFHKSYLLLFSLLFLNVLWLLDFSFATRLIKGEGIDPLFSQYYIKDVPDKLCDLEKEKKVAICNVVMADKDFYNDFEMYLNKVGITRNHHLHNCEKHPVTLKIIDSIIRLKPEHKMFPCFGRHDPVRSSWNLDDHYNVIFLSQGSEPNSVFIFILKLFPKSELYQVYGLMRDIFVDSLPENSFNEAELAYELESLNILSRNNFIPEIETLFIRKAMSKSLQISDKVCNLNVEQKMELCNMMLQKTLFRDYFWKLNKDAFIYFNSKCVISVIEFAFFVNYNESVFMINMYPCFGNINEEPIDHENDKVSTTFYLSGGFRANSVLIFSKFMSDTYSMIEFVENVKLDNISGNNYSIKNEG